MHEEDFILNPFNYKTKEEKELEAQRLKRFEVARKIYNDLSREHQRKYEEEKRKKEEKLTYMPKSKKELEKRREEIELLKRALRAREEGIGTGQKNAIEEEMQREEEEKYAEMERKRIAEIAQERYRIALEELHQTNTVPPQYLKKAKDRANQRERSHLQRFVDIKNQKKPTQSITVESVLMPRKANTITNQSIKTSQWGSIPVNEEALQYKKQLEDSAKAQKLAAKRRKKIFRDRSKAAAFRAKCEKICTDLQEDVDSIRKYEIDSHLTKDYIKKPASQIPMIQTYLIEDRYQKKSDAIQMFLSAPEIPKPRKSAPVPLPVHALPPSPVQSENEYEEDLVMNNIIPSSHS